MSIFDLFKTSDINDGVRKMRETEDSVLLDVRTREEYAQGHIPGSINIPLNEIDTVKYKITDKTAPVFVHCLSGARSSRAVSYMKQAGYTNVTDIGGIHRYRGETEKGAAV